MFVFGSLLDYLLSVSVTVIRQFSHLTSPQICENSLTPEHFKGACLAILKTGKGAFTVNPGDIDPPGCVYDMVNTVLGPDYPWYPVIGNHEAETPEDMEWLRKYGRGKLLDHVSSGLEGSEETTYSFDYKNSHIVVINEYYDGQSAKSYSKPARRKGGNNRG